jgi:hypothetical protein
LHNTNRLSAAHSTSFGDHPPASRNRTSAAAVRSAIAFAGDVDGDAEQMEPGVVGMARDPQRARHPNGRRRDACGSAVDRLGPPSAIWIASS